MGVVNIRGIPEQTHRDAKAAAAKTGMTLQAWVIAAIVEKLERTKQ